MKFISKVIALSILCSYMLIAQCSDAGVCVIGSKRFQQEHQIGASYSFAKSGKADDLTFHSVQIEGNFQLFSRSNLLVTFPWSIISGPLGETNGIGDLTLLWNQEITRARGNKLSVQAGVKLATGSANSGKLPQAYQPGLGTNDLIFGIAGEIESWLFAIGYQLSSGRSDNTIDRLKRGDDIFVKAGYKTSLDDFRFGFEVLAIQRMQLSSRLDTNGSGNDSFITIPGSDQLQINLLPTLSVPISDRFSLHGFVAVPVRSRNVNVDGLTRSITISTGVQASL